MKNVRFVIQVIISHTLAEQYILDKLFEITKNRNIDFQIFRAIIANNSSMNHDGVIYPDFYPSDQVSKNFLTEFEREYLDYPNYNYLDNSSYEKENKLYSSPNNARVIEEVFLQYGIKLLIR